jgi:predicted ATPase/transcriptional regulator with XRE-family HTH domain/Tfp pilus assembly protein PilF
MSHRETVRIVMDEARTATFGVALKRFRVAAGLSQEALAEQANLSARAISALERGVNSSPRLETVALLAAALCLSAEDRATLEAAVPRRRGPRTALPPPRVGVPRSLPSPPTTLIGREREGSDMVALLGRDDVRLLTLTGPSGVGKTSLALRVANDVAASYRDGVVFVSLSAVIDPGHVAATIAQVVGLRETMGQQLADTLVDYFRSRRALLLLDNFEHVMAAAPLIARLRGDCADLTIVATSQGALRLRGEQEFAVPPLALPDLTEDTEMARSPAVRLFIERARAIRPDLPIENGDIVTIARICERLDGLPLAIELAASRVKMLPLPALLSRLTHQLDVLTGGARDLPERQQTMRAAIAWSYDLLDGAEQTLFRRLAVFAGGCTVEAAHDVCAEVDGAGDLVAGDAVFNLLATLVDRALLRQVQYSEVEPRLRMLQTVREYGLERLRESGEVATVQHRHALYMTRFAERAEGELAGPQQTLWLAGLEGEHNNLRAALRWSEESGVAELGLRLAAALWRFWYVRGYPGEGREWLEKMLSLSGPDEPACDDGADDTVRTKALTGAGMLTYSQGDYPRASALFERALALCRSLDDTQGIATTLNYLASVARDQGDYRRAISLFEESLALRRALGDTRGIAASLNNLGLVARDRGEYERATRLHEESLALKRDLGDRLGVAYSRNNLGVVAREKGDFDQARRLFEDSLTALRDLGDARGIATALNNIAVIARADGDYARATALCDECVALRRDLGDKWGLTYALNTLGDIARDQGDYARATALYEESLVLIQQVRDHLSLAACVEGLAAVAVLRGQPARAVQLYGAAATRRETNETPLPPADRAVHDRLLCEACAALGDRRFDEAWALGRALTLDDAIAVAMSEG